MSQQVIKHLGSRLLLLGCVFLIGLIRLALLRNPDIHQTSFYPDPHTTQDLQFLSPTISSKTIKAPATPPPNGITPLNYYKRPAGEGTIVEAGEFLPGNQIKISNIWVSNREGEKIIIKAGAKIFQSQGYKIQQPEQWMGLIIVQFEDKDGNQISDKEGTYYAPSTEGIILIINVDNDILTLVSPADTVYDFNLAIEQFVSTEKHKVKSRSSGDGRIYERNLISYPIDGYIFNNYW